MRNKPYSSIESIVIAADIGGSHITVAPIDISSSQAVSERMLRARVNSRGTREDILNTWCNVLEMAFASFNERPDKLALAMPGPFDYENGICYIRGLDKYESLYGINIKEELANTLNLSHKHVLFRNDAEAFLHGEVATGLVEMNNRVLGLTLGTGMGTAFSYAGKTIDLNLGSESYQTSIADDFFTTRWFVNRYEELSGNKVTNVEALSELSGKDKTVDVLFDEYASRLTNFLAGHIVDLRIDTLVFGGNISKANRLFLPKFSAMLAAKGITPAVKLALQGEQSAMIGAAFLFNAVQGTHEPKIIV
jgi:glucokinase